MKSLVLEKKDTLSLRDFPEIDREEEALGPRDVRIKLHTVGICGSDVHYYTHGKIGSFVVNAPMILGHEASGIVIETGSEVTTLKEGDRVCMEPGIPDPNSKATRMGMYNVDPAVRFWATPPVHGILRPTCVHPEGFTFKLPDNVSFAEAAMVEPLAVGVHAATKARIKPGDIAVVIGAGPIGLVTALSAIAAGCARVYVADLAEKKLEIAAGLSGAIVPINVTVESIAERVAADTDGWGADVVFEATGSPRAAAGVFEPLAPGGCVVMIGGQPDPISYDAGAAMVREARVENIFRYAHVFPRCVSMLASGLIDVKPLITRTFGFDESVNAFEIAASAPPADVKMQIELPQQGGRPMADVKIDNVIKRFGNTQVMHGVSVDIEDGEFVVLVGPSGCGKSTLLRMLAGLEQISDGTISIGGRVVNNVLPKERDIAMVFQSYALYPHKTVFDNIGFPLKMAKRPQSEIDDKVNKAAEVLDLSKYLKRYPKELSGGQRQRVAMGRAIVRDPQVFLFDEPLSNLDAKLRVTMRVEIKELHQRLGTTIVYVTHDQIEAMTMADKIVVMRDGRVEQIGSPLDLYDRPDNVFVAGFIGSPSMNFVRGKVATVDGTRKFVSDTGLTLPLPETAAAEGHEVIYGIRPEHIQIGEGGVPMSVVVVEPTGSETQVFAKSGKDLVDALVKDRIMARPGSTLGFIIDPADVHLFDRKSEQRL